MRIEKNLPELIQLERIIKKAPKELVCIENLGEVKVDDTKFPLTGLVIGNKNDDVPVFGLFGGVHGLERIGAQIVLSFLESLFEQCSWDKDLYHKLSQIKILAFPVVNPGGIAMGKRSNPRGIDLMRNAPISADSPVTFLVGGHRLSSMLPWYRGRKKDPMQLESQAVVDFVKKHSFNAPFLLTLDVHSGFGMRDRIWYPYAKTKSLFPREQEVKKLITLLDSTYPFHVYRVESQSDNYLTHGDLWDYLYSEHESFYQNMPAVTPIFIPLTLEIGSWLWIRKNPKQLFSLTGIFNPILPHRQNRILRRHMAIIDFLFRATKNYLSWSEERKKIQSLVV